MKQYMSYWLRWSFVSVELTGGWSTNRPSLNVEDRPPANIETDSSGPVKLDATAQAHIEKHRYYAMLETNVIK